MVYASAPGRLDVMGGIADYSGSLVLQMPLREETRCRIERRRDRIIEVRSASRPDVVRIALDALVPGGKGELTTYGASKAHFLARPETHWASYVVGVIQVLIVEERIVPDTGLSILIESDVPEGKGVSSSAALEVAAMRACLSLTNRQLPPERIAVLCQLAENQVAGAPCGIMDQMTSACGERGKLMRLLCQPAELQGFVDLPEGVAVWGIDSGVRHAVTGSDYSSVRAAAFMGLRIIEEEAGEAANDFGGYLANVGPEALRTRYLHRLPERINGRDFLAAYGGISDSVVGVDPDGTYLVRASASHAILEHDRVNRFASMLDGNPDEKQLAMAGELMYLSHAGYSACGLGSDGTDRIVELVKETGYKQGLFGARITGGGSGGTVAVLAFLEAEPIIRDIAARYAEETGRKVQVF